MPVIDVETPDTTTIPSQKVARSLRIWANVLTVIAAFCCLSAIGNLCVGMSRDAVPGNSGTENFVVFGVMAVIAVVFLLSGRVLKALAQIVINTGTR